MNFIINPNTRYTRILKIIDQKKFPFPTNTSRSLNNRKIKSRYSIVSIRGISRSELNRFLLEEEWRRREARRFRRPSCNRYRSPCDHDRAKETGHMELGHRQSWLFQARKRLLFFMAFCLLHLARARARASRALAARSLIEKFFAR